jgi:hypothetical protein
MVITTLITRCIMTVAWAAVIDGGSTMHPTAAGLSGSTTLPGLYQPRAPQRTVSGSIGSRTSAPTGGNTYRADRRLTEQTATRCIGNNDTAQDVVCTGGSVEVESFATVVVSDQDTCCTCPPGTTAVYGDENLAFRFRPDSITTAADGSLLWPAVEPAGLAFTMTRLEEPHEHHDETEADAYYLVGNASEPSRNLPADFLPGLLWEHGEDAGYDQGMRAHIIGC